MTSFNNQIAAAFEQGAVEVDVNGRLRLSGVAGGGATVQQIPFATSITPDPSRGSVLDIGVIGGGFTINNPVNAQPGMELEFHFTQAQTSPRTPTWGSHFQPGASDLISLAPGGRSVVKFRAVTATRWDLVNVGADTSFSEQASVYRGAVPTQTAGSTKVPRWVNRTGQELSVTGVFVDVSTAPSGAPATFVVRKNGSATGEVTVSIGVGASVGVAAAAFSLSPGDYLEVWSTAPNGTTDAVVTFNGRKGGYVASSPTDPGGGGGDPGGGGTPNATVSAVMISDMRDPHQGPLDGVPSGYDWAGGPTHGSATPPGGMTAATAWGQVYSSQNGSTNTWVSVANMRLYFLVNGIWQTVQATRPQGAMALDAFFFVADFVGNETSPEDVRTESDGSRSGRPNDSYNMHFWPQNRALVPAGATAVAVSYDARLILNNTSGVDDRASARFLAGAGGDWWQTLTNAWPGNDGMGLGRHRWVGTEWQTYTMFQGLTDQQITANPPPVPLQPATRTDMPEPTGGTPGGGGGDPGGGTGGTPSTDLQAVLTNDMTLPHEGPLDGVPDYYDWAAGPRLGMGNNTQGMQASTAWGEVYASSNPAQNTLVQVSDLSLYFLRSDGTWWIAQRTVAGGSIGMDAGYFQSDFQGNVTAQFSPITLSDGTKAAKPDPFWNFHFFPQGRVTIPSGFQAVASSFKARLIVNPAGGVDDRAQARFLAGAGGDFWQTLSNPWTGSGSNGDFAIGRHRWVTNEWQTYTAHTLTASQIANNPPPIDLTSAPGGGSGSGGGGTDPGGGSTSSTWTRPINRDILIMPVGDSITWYMGNESSGYTNLGAQLNNAGYPGRTVGNETGYNGVKHQGIGAWCADDTNNRCTHNNGFHAGGIIQNIVGWLNTHNPDVVVLNIGTNDRYVQQSASDQQIAEWIGTIIDLVAATKPECITLVTTLKYWENVTNSGNVNADLNSRLPGIISGRQAANKKCLLFDQYRYVTQASDFQGQWDVHPTNAGVGKMLQATRETLVSLFQGAAVRS